MSICKTPTLIIDNTDAVGDSAGKHNYNTLVLDTNICNLSSQFFLDYGNVNTIFQSITSYIDTFTQIASSFNDLRVYKMSEVATSVKILSSYWNRQEFSIQYPINGAILDNADTINAPALSSINQVNILNSIQSRLKPLADLHINANFPATSFIDGTIININFFLYNISPNPTNPNHLITFNSTPNIFSYLNRQMNVSFYRDNVYFTQGVNLKYYKINNVWNYVGYNAGKYSYQSPNISLTTKSVATKNALQVQIPNKVLKSTIFTSTSTIRIPADVTKVLLFLVGGGGGGGAGYTGVAAGGGGGGGGITYGVYAVIPNTTYTVTIGNGGNGGLAGGTGSTGGSTIFNSISADGGFGGWGANPSISSASLGGNSGGGGDFGQGGQGRTLTLMASAGSNGFEYTDIINYPNGMYFVGGGGGGADTGDILPIGGLGGGGKGGVGAGFPGSNGIVNTGGGGGGGGPSNGNGGSGGKGIAIISYYTIL